MIGANTSFMSATVNFIETVLMSGFRSQWFEATHQNTAYAFWGLVEWRWLFGSKCICRNQEVEDSLWNHEHDNNRSSFKEFWDGCIIQVLFLCLRKKRNTLPRQCGYQNLTHTQFQNVL